MLDLTLKDGWCVIKGPKVILVLTREEFITALRRGKWWKRAQALTQRLPRGERSTAPEPSLDDLQAPW